LLKIIISRQNIYFFSSNQCTKIYLLLEENNLNPSKYIHNCVNLNLVENDKHHFHWRKNILIYFFDNIPVKKLLWFYVDFKLILFCLDWKARFYILRVHNWSLTWLRCCCGNRFICAQPNVKGSPLIKQINQTHFDASAFCMKINIQCQSFSNADNFNISFYLYKNIL